MLTLYLAAAISFYFAYLIYERIQNTKNRKKIKHVVHINGIRGKSSTVRLIDAGLRAGGIKTFCKTTGTLPMIIDTKNEEQLIKRRGRANIKEQIKILKQAADQGAQVLVIECMAVSPILQNISQHKILHGDICAITNTRADHLDEMGSTLSEIANSLSNTIPIGGSFFTCDEENFDFFKEKCERQGTKAALVKETSVDYGFDFNENIELSLSICQELGVPRDIACEGMKNYKRDPFALSIHEIKTENGHSVLFIDGFSINDPDSIEKVFAGLKNKQYFESRKFILLINNRNDRPYRMKQHIELAIKLNSHEIWLTGAYTGYMKRKINSKSLNKVSLFKKAEEIDFKKLNEDSTVFAIGNIANNGDKIAKRAMEAGVPYER